MSFKTKKVTLAVLFGALIFLSKVLMPFPLDKMFIFLHALLLVLGNLLLGRLGATYVATVGGILTAMWKTALAPFSFAIALLYGLLVDGFIMLFKINPTEDNKITIRLIAATTISTAVLGLLGLYITAFVFKLIQRNPTLEATMLVVGAINGAAAGYFAYILWNKYLRKLNSKLLEDR